MSGVDGREDGRSLNARDPSRTVDLCVREGSKAVLPPMAIVWPCPLSVDAYVAVGRDVEVPAPSCPSCTQTMAFWGFYTRYLRVGEVVRLVVRRVRCGRCRCSHAMLPDFVTKGRLDAVEVIGQALDALAGDSGARQAAITAGVPHTTVRDWRRRVVERCGLLTSGFLAATVALGDPAPRQLASGLAGLLVAIDAACTAARRRLGAAGSRWRVANRIVGGELCSTNTDPPWAAG